jgi:hypothetical protein
LRACGTILGEENLRSLAAAAVAAANAAKNSQVEGGKSLPKFAAKRWAKLFPYTIPLRDAGIVRLTLEDASEE